MLFLVKGGAKKTWGGVAEYVPLLHPKSQDTSLKVNGLINLLQAMIY